MSCLRTVVQAIRMLVHRRMISSCNLTDISKCQHSFYYIVVEGIMMKDKKSVFIEGDILSKSCHGQIGQHFCIHRVRFSNDKYAIVREASGICFKPGEVIQRNDCNWFYNLIPIRLLSFEYVGEDESRRQFLEYH